MKREENILSFFFFFLTKRRKIPRSSFEFSSRYFVRVSVYRFEKRCSDLHKRWCRCIGGRRRKERERAKERRANRGDISHAREHMLEPVTARYIGKDRTRCVPDESTFSGCVPAPVIRRILLFHFIFRDDPELLTFSFLYIRAFLFSPFSWHSLEGFEGL